MSDLNERQKRFCEEYIACKFNGTQAAINAGYSEKTARSIAAENLTKPDIQNYLALLFENDKEAVGIDISKNRVLLEIGRLAFVDVRKFYGTDGQLLCIKDLDDDTAAALSGIESYEEKVSDASADEVVVAGTTKKIKTYDKPKALEMLAKMHKIYTDAPVVNNHLRFGYGEEKPV
ncbi:MAG: terminase small subunit [Bacteroidota bacterium]